MGPVGRGIAEAAARNGLLPCTVCGSWVGRFIGVTGSDEIDGTGVVHGAGAFGLAGKELAGGSGLETSMISPCGTADAGVCSTTGGSAGTMVIGTVRTPGKTDAGV